MKLPGTARLRFPALLALVAALAFLHPAVSQSNRAAPDADADRTLRHQNPDWLLIAPHLPDPKTATPAALELEADVLHARRFDEDALEYYQYALERGGEPGRLMNRMGVLELEMRQPELARICFHRVLALHPKEAMGWNNLGAAEYLLANYRPALDDYRRAVKLEKKNAIFHANLGTAYFEVKDFESAHGQFALASRLDHDIFNREDAGGVQAHVLSASDRGRFCFELARVAASQHNDAAVLAWLTKASEMGFDIRNEMGGAKVFQTYFNDPRVLLIEANARALRLGKMVADGPVPVLPPETPRD